MKIKGKVHCLFEQSGTFKNEFIKLGIPAVDYDIQNNFNETNHICDLFIEIEKGYNNEVSIFDNIKKDDLIIAFYPCTYFTGSSNPLFFNLSNLNFRGLSDKDKFEMVLMRDIKRHKSYQFLYKLCAIVLLRGFRMIIENPYSTQHYLYNNFLKEPDIIDKNRMLRGDYFIKPTAYWFFNCEPTHGYSFQIDKKQKKIKKLKYREERSMISLDYARNFICDFVLGKEQKISTKTLF